MHLSLYICMYVCMYVYIYIYTYKHIHMYIYIHSAGDSIPGLWLSGGTASLRLLV